LQVYWISSNWDMIFFQMDTSSHHLLESS
jgi:hypothetical protein